MQYPIPHTKLLRLALITSPLFGILGAMPAFAMVNENPNRMIHSFFVVMLITCLIWASNLMLLSLFNRNRLRSLQYVRYMLTILTGLALGLLVFYFFFNFQPQPRFLIQLPDNGMNRITGVPVQPAIRLTDPPIRSLLMPGLQILSIAIIILVLTELIILKEHKQDIERENDRLRLTNLEARHSQLKQQLHPHFLFNSLNTLKTLISREPVQAESYLIKLSALLRFSLYANKEEIVPVRTELELCIHYLHMQEVRFGRALTFEIEIPDELKQNGYLPVYSLQLLAENAIKHNCLSTQQPLHIRILGDPAAESITVTNNLQPKLTMEDGTGLGLSNLAERYRLLGKAGIGIRRGQGQFAVTLNIIQHERSNY